MILIISNDWLNETRPCVEWQIVSINQFRAIVQYTFDMYFNKKWGCNKLRYYLFCLVFVGTFLKIFILPSSSRYECKYFKYVTIQLGIHIVFFI